MPISERWGPWKTEERQALARKHLEVTGGDTDHYRRVFCALRVITTLCWFTVLIFTFFHTFGYLNAPVLYMIFLKSLDSSQITSKTINSLSCPFVTGPILRN